MIWRDLAVGLIYFMAAVSGSSVLAQDMPPRPGAAPAATAPKGPLQTQRPGRVPGGTADHTKFEILKKEFKSGPEVTAACLTCHTEASHQLMDSIHWTWTFKHPGTGQMLGKSKVINSFCGNVASNEPRCTSCHAGYGWEKLSEGPPKELNRVDCLVCHDRTATYTKLEDKAGHPPLAPLAPKAKTITGINATPVDLSHVAQHVGMPGRENCGQCHFYGGGGDNVKHGDLSSALVAPSRNVDVHMDKDGLNFACSACHTSKQHKWPGSRYDVLAHDTKGAGKPGERRDVATCESCHGASPHKAASLTGIKLNDHVDRVACQTCHIPAFAKGGVATKTKWDMSTAGRLKDGKPFQEEGFVQGDGKHLHTYLSTKGDFEWGENVMPYYAWFDGQMRFTSHRDKIDPSRRVEINTFGGSASDPRARIWPFKLMVGRQAYDKQYLTLLHNQVYGPDTTTAFWTNFDWAKSLKAAMDYVGEPYSGEFGFIDTAMYWPITHMVAPKAEALACESCHAKNGRMANIAGIYMPGGASSGWGRIVDLIGLAMLFAAVAGVVGHALVRVVASFGRTRA